MGGQNPPYHQDQVAVRASEILWPGFGCGSDTKSVASYSGDKKGREREGRAENGKEEKRSSISALKAMLRGQGVTFWLQTRPPDSEVMPDLFLLALYSSHLPFNWNESGFSLMQGGRRRATVSKTRD